MKNDKLYPFGADAFHRKMGVGSANPRRNSLLYLYGWFSFCGAIMCLLIMLSSDTMVLGVNAWMKPAKFFISIAVFCWTMQLYTAHLIAQHKVKVYSWAVV